MGSATGCVRRARSSNRGLSSSGRSPRFSAWAARHPATCVASDSCGGSSPSGVVSSAAMCFLAASAPVRRAAGVWSARTDWNRTACTPCQAIHAAARPAAVTTNFSTWRSRKSAMAGPFNEIDGRFMCPPPVSRLHAHRQNRRHP